MASGRGLSHHNCGARVTRDSQVTAEAGDPQRPVGSILSAAVLVLTDCPLNLGLWGPQPLCLRRSVAMRLAQLAFLDIEAQRLPEEFAFRSALFLGEALGRLMEFWGKRNGYNFCVSHYASLRVALCNTEATR